MAATSKVELNKKTIATLERAGPRFAGKFADNIADGVRQRVPVAPKHKDPWPGVRGPVKDSIKSRMRKNPDDGAFVSGHYYLYFLEFGHEDRAGGKVAAQHNVARALAAAEGQIDAILDAVT